MLTLASIVKKTAMAITGLLWVIFLIGHLVGNFKLFKGPEAFNAYAKFIESLGPLLIAAELGLIALLLTHIYSGLKVSLENRSARPHSYVAQVERKRGRALSFSRSMLIGGVLLTIFIVFHVATFKFGNHHGDNGLHGLVIRSFQNRFTVAFYILAMVALGMHLSHGLGSALQTLGVGKPSWGDRLRNAGTILGWLIAAGFISFPVWAFFAH